MVRRGACYHSVHFCKIALQVFRGHYCLDYQIPRIYASAAGYSGSGVVLAMLIVGLLMTSMVTQLTLPPSACWAQSDSPQLN